MGKVKRLTRVGSDTLAKKTLLVWVSLIVRVSLIVGVSPLAPAAANAGDDFSFQQSNPAPCGQDCLYQRANENLTLQSLYTHKRANQSNDPEKRGDLVKTYCTPEEQSDEAAIDRCMERFRRAEGIRLQKIRGAMIQNNDEIYQLGGGDQGEGRFILRSRAAGANASPETGSLPNVPTLQDLKKIHDRNGPLRPDQIKELTDAQKKAFDAPDESAFVKTTGKVVPGATLPIHVKSGPAGNYDKIKEFYKNDAKIAEDRKAAQNTETATAILADRIKNRVDFEKGLSAEQKEAYGQARAIMIKEAKVMLSGKGKATAAPAVRGVAFTKTSLDRKARQDAAAKAKSEAADATPEPAGDSRVSETKTHVSAAPVTPADLSEPLKDERTNRSNPANLIMNPNELNDSAETLIDADINLYP